MTISNTFLMYVLYHYGSVQHRSQRVTLPARTFLDYSCSVWRGSFVISSATFSACFLHYTRTGDPVVQLWSALCCDIKHHASTFVLAFRLPFPQRCPRGALAAAARAGEDLSLTMAHQLTLHRACKECAQPLPKHSTAAPPAPMTKIPVRCRPSLHG